MARRVPRRPAVPALAAAAALPAAGPHQAVHQPNRPGGEDFAHSEPMLVDVQNRPSVAPPEGLEIRIVMHGAGVDPLPRAARADERIASRIDELARAGLRLSVRAITAEPGTIPLAELYDTEESDLVPSGVFEIARPQRRQGFAELEIRASSRPGPDRRSARAAAIAA